MNNVFKTCTYYRWNSFKNIASNIGLFFRRFKWAYQRAIKGYADCDIWNMDQWLLDLFHGSLNHLADHHYGFPGNEEFKTNDDWIHYLKETANLFYQANEANDFYPTPEGDKWQKWFDENVDNKDFNELSKNPYGKAMFHEERWNQMMRETDFQSAWQKMGHVFWHLWD